MSYLDRLKALGSVRDAPARTARTAKSAFDSYDSTPQCRIHDRDPDEEAPRESVSSSAPKVTTEPPATAGAAGTVIDYTLLDLQVFDALIAEYVGLAIQEPEARNLKRVELLAARRQMAPARVRVELAEFRALVDEIEKVR